MERPPASEPPPAEDNSSSLEAVDGSGLFGGVIDPNSGGAIGNGSEGGAGSLTPGRAGAPLVRAEEALIVLLVLLLWGAAIALFFNRWGKIRMLEPYQPKFQQQAHRASCPMLELTATQHRTFSKFNLNCTEAGYSSMTGRGSVCAGAGSSRPRQNSVFAGSSCLVSTTYNPPPPRKAKSAMDLQVLMQAEELEESGAEEESGLLGPLPRRVIPPYRPHPRRTSIVIPHPPPHTPVHPPTPPPPPPPPPVILPATPALLRVTNV